MPVSVAATGSTVGVHVELGNRHAHRPPGAAALAERARGPRPQRRAVAAQDDRAQGRAELGVVGEPLGVAARQLTGSATVARPGEREGDHARQDGRHEDRRDE